MAYITPIPSVVAFQSNPSSLLVGASIIGLTPVNVTNSVVVTQPTAVNLNATTYPQVYDGSAFHALHGDVSGNIGASVIGVTPVNLVSSNASVITVGGGTTGNSSVTAYQGGAWSTSITGGYSNVIGSVLVTGSVATYQGTNPWIVNQPSPSIIAYQAAGSVMAVSGSFTAGNTSVTAFQGGIWAVSVVGGPLNINSILGTYQENNASTPSAIGIPFLFKESDTTSVLSTVSPLNPLPTVGSVSGTVNVNTINNPLPAGTNSLGSVTALQGTNPWIVNATGSIAAALQSTTASVINVWGTFTRMTSVMNTLPSSLMVGASVFGTVPVTQVTSPWVVNVPTSSYLSIQPGGSVLNAQISGSVAAAITNISASIAVNQNTNPWIIGSIVGTYQEDAPATSADRGLFVLGVRNDTMSSMTSSDLDYSSHVVGPAGEMITANSPITKWISGATSVMYGTSVQVLAAPGTSIFTYITGINVINESANASRVTITQGRGGTPASMLTWAIAPAGGGSNTTFLNPLRVLDNNGVSASISGVSSVFVTITGFTAKT